MSLSMCSAAHRLPPTLVPTTVVMASAAACRWLAHPDTLSPPDCCWGAHSLPHCSQPAKTRLGLGLKFFRLFVIFASKIEFPTWDKYFRLLLSVKHALLCFSNIMAHPVTLPPPNSASTSWSVGILPGSCLTAPSVGDGGALLYPKKALPMVSRAWGSVPSEVEHSSSPGFRAQPRPHLGVPTTPGDIPCLQHRYSLPPFLCSFTPSPCLGRCTSWVHSPLAESVPGPIGRGHLAENLP
ncbi:hypothetical protein mRhiFer1_009211 [Rhinolophus ferrumequinum]|uniref:Uncharacterized protein n=1 Tax=Rhinolophus ferrumequinum TaxID=59479 RepID=A0A7J7SKA0_RHIFE|nr:hypothetical protein mRhiFer1_009211 [Rhinolophus ferrumequinum]